MSTEWDGEDFVSVVVPAYQEAGGLVAVLEGLVDMLQDLPCRSEVIVVDDGSGDETADRAVRVPGVRLLRNPVNLGYGHSLMRGIAAARGNLIAITDADGTYPAGAIPDLYAWIRRGSDHAIGARTGPHLGRLLVLRTLYRWLCGYVAGTRVPDANSGLRLFRREIVENLRVDLCRGFSFTTSLTLASLMAGYVVTFAPIPYGRRVGRSHVRARDALRTAQYLFQLIAVYNPLKLFLPVVALAFVLAVMAFALAWLGSWSGGFLGSAVLLAATVVLVGLAAHAYIVSRTALHPAPLIARSPIEEDTTRAPAGARARKEPAEGRRGAAGGLR